MRAVCVIQGCARPHCARGWCKNHYYSWKRNGDPTARKILPPGSTVADALEWYVDRSAGPDRCWPWTGARIRGNGRWGHYGISGVAGHSRLAHRMAWEVAVGPVPEGMFVCHRCDNPPCCNPAHLFLGTAADNNRDMVTKRRDRRPIGDAHPNARLTTAAVEELRMLRVGGWSLAALAAQFRISQTSVYNAVHCKTYKPAGVTT